MMTDEEKRAEIHRLREEADRLESTLDASRCTGVAATWCPVCGDCTCPQRKALEDIEDDEEGEDPRCPLHGRTSPHAEDALRQLARSRP